mmetsp:Transcript_29327/g.58538  ORF Transcript_29327/g.58538 Transcript_29327/m.58538 type:complete len:92 (-) Transcript_29327:86-361(-)
MASSERVAHEQYQHSPAVFDHVERAMVRFSHIKKVGRTIAGGILKFSRHTQRLISQATSKPCEENCSWIYSRLIIGLMFSLCPHGHNEGSY